MASRIFARRRATWLATLVLLLFGGCGTEPQCDICTTSAVVYGSVTQGGTAVAGATVTATPYADSCAGRPAGSDEPAFTDAAGQYRVQPHAAAAPFVACVRVRARTAAGAEVTAESAPVRFREDFRPGRRESVRVDLTLPTP